MNLAQLYLLQNNLDDIVLNADQYPENIPENAKKWIYLSDVLINFEKRQDIIKDVCPVCGYPKLKKSFEKFERCEGCNWTSK